MKIKIIIFLILALFLLSACANVHQIDRYYLGKRIMQYEPDAHRDGFRNEFNTIREGASGGTGQNAGGGCGCN